MNNGNASAPPQESAVERLLTLVALAADAAEAVEGIVVLGPDSVDVTAASGSKDQALSLDTTGDWILLRIPRQAVAEEMRGIHYVELKE